MRAVMISIRPKWCGLIALGEKTIEVRKTKPKLNAPFKCYIYCTNERKLKFWAGKRYSYADDRSHNLFDRCGNGKVIGEFVCDAFVTDRTYGHDPMFRAAACMNQVEAAYYCLNAKMYGWHISDLKIYDEPKELSDFFVYCERCDKRPIECKYGYEVNNESGYYSECMCDFKRPIERPPQSWCYVEEA